jgi:hypothetical protein
MLANCLSQLTPDALERRIAKVVTWHVKSAKEFIDSKLMPLFQNAKPDFERRISILRPSKRWCHCFEHVSCTVWKSMIQKGRMTPLVEFVDNNLDDVLCDLQETACHLAGWLLHTRLGCRLQQFASTELCKGQFP